MANHSLVSLPAVPSYILNNQTKLVSSQSIKKCQISTSRAKELQSSKRGLRVLISPFSLCQSKWTNLNQNGKDLRKPKRTQRSSGFCLQHWTLSSKFKLDFHEDVAVLLQVI